MCEYVRYYVHVCTSLNHNFKPVLCLHITHQTALKPHLLYQLTCEVEPDEAGAT